MYCALCYCKTKLCFLAGYCFDPKFLSRDILMAYLLASGTTALFKGVLLYPKMDNQGIENLKMHSWCIQGIFSLKAKTKLPQEILVRERKGGKTNQSNYFPPLKEQQPLRLFLMNHKTREGGSREKQKLYFYCW